MAKRILYEIIAMEYPGLRIKIVDEKIIGGIGISHRLKGAVIVNLKNMLEYSPLQDYIIKELKRIYRTIPWTKKECDESSKKGIEPTWCAKNHPQQRLDEWGEKSVE